VFDRAECLDGAAQQVGTPEHPPRDLLQARVIATQIRRDGLRHLERDAVARVIERSARLAGDQERLT
jgi:predicted ATP-dependent protease